MNNIVSSSMLMSFALLAACVTGDQSGQAAVDRSAPVCLSDFDIRSFSPLSDEFVYIEALRDAHYLLTMQRGCLGLRSAHEIGFPDQPGRICSNSLDDVVYEDFSRGQTSCRILGIERVGSRDEARELADARRQARRER